MVGGPLSKSPPLVLSLQQRLLLVVYQLAWYVGMPAVFLFFWLRGRKEPLYRQFWAERLGRIDSRLHAPIWVHCVSLGELRGVMPLIDKLLAEKLPVLITTLTPAGRAAANQRYGHAIANGQLQVSYLPLEFSWAVRAFARSVQPHYMVSSESDIWPVLLHTLKRIGIPLGFINAQYPQTSYIKDQSWAGFRAAFIRAYDIVLCKSELHAKRFIASGCAQVHVVGELRFDLPTVPAQFDAATRLRTSHPGLLAGRAVICMASVVEGEDDLMLAAYRRFASEMQARGQPKPFLVYVPRSPQRFDEVATRIQAFGWRLLRRSTAFNAELQFVGEMDERADVLLGDSLGEMVFYLALADTVTVCGSFAPRGSHNIIEALALNKPVIVGPSIWGIEYPAQEALAAGVLTQVFDAEALPAQWLKWFSEPELREQSLARSKAFMREHSDSVGRHWLHLSQWLRSRG